MKAFLVLGFLLGMRHALEADHLAAVAALSTKAGGRLATALRGAAWGVGHTMSLLVVGGACLVLGASISPAQSRWFERAVGVMLVILGVNVLARIRSLHVHVHKHDDGVVHLHAHHHAPDEPHDPRHHAHGHGVHLRAVAVGMVHGLAGSAALLLLAASAIESRWLGLAYIGVFGVGSIVGMTLLTAVIAVPLHLTATRLTRAYTAVEVVVSIGTIALGVAMLR